MNTGYSYIEEGGKEMFVKYIRPLTAEEAAKTIEFIKSNRKNPRIFKDGVEIKSK